MDSVIWFWVALGATVALLALALFTGLRRTRRTHLMAGPAAMGALVVAVLMTENLSRRYEFEANAKAIHLVCAKTGGILALLVVLTGVWLWRNPRVRRLHAFTVWLFVTGTLVATGTGIWMFSTGTLKS